MLALQFCEMNSGNVYFCRTKGNWPISAPYLQKTKMEGCCVRGVIWPGCCHGVGVRWRRREPAGRRPGAGGETHHPVRRPLDMGRGR